MSNEKRKSYARGFLNPVEGVAAYEWKTLVWHENCLSSYFKISDCNRTVALDFDWDNEKQRKEKLEKLDILIAELQKYKEDITRED